MFKSVFFYQLCLGVFLISCRNSNDDVPFIDQKVQIFIDSAGQDMLNSKMTGSYSTILFNDVNGATDITPVSFTMKKTPDTINYIEYLAGAKRISTGINTDGSTNYQSKIAVSLKKKKGNNMLVVTDTLVLNYHMSSSLFQINNAKYNGVLVFVKQEGVENKMKISK
jgi:hypothetical protein